MNDMSAVIVPKSDQMNADDLIAGPRTIRVSGVDIRAGTEQPVSIHYEGDEGKPYKPCKSMCRIMVAAWGPDAKRYVGRAMTLYRDPGVKWGGMEVGGIRISHMSDIEKTMVLALTATKGSRKPYTVRPLAAPAATRSENGAAVIEAARRAATNGVAAYQAFFGGLSRDERAMLVNDGHHATNKSMATAADAPSASTPDMGPDYGTADQDEGRFPPAGDDFPGDAPSAVETARQRGAEAKRDGLNKRAKPAEYRSEGREAEYEAWLEGFEGAAVAEEV